MIQIEFDPIPREGLELDQLMFRTYSVALGVGRVYYQKKETKKCWKYIQKY